MEPITPIHPFAPGFWSGPHRPDAEALWTWHYQLQAVFDATEPGLDPAEIEAMADQIRNGESPALLDPAPLDPAVVDAALAVCRRNQLPFEALADQVEWLRYAGGARFDTFQDLNQAMNLGPVAHGRLLAQLGRLAIRFDMPKIDELSRAHFLTGRLVCLPVEVRLGRFWIADQEREAAGVTREQLLNGTIDESMKRLLWKQVVRIRDRMARARPLVPDWPRKFQRSFKRWWHTNLEVLDQIERRDYDLWSSPITLSKAQELKLHLQTILSRASFKRG